MVGNIINIFVLLVFFNLINFASFAAQACDAKLHAFSCVDERRGAFDFGSGSIKLQIADVSICLGKGGEKQVKVKRVYFRDALPALFTANFLMKSPQGATRLHPDGITEGKRVIQSLLEQARPYLEEHGGLQTVDFWGGIATEVFRGMVNWPDVKKAFENSVHFESKQETKCLTIQLLSQDEEAYYGYFPLLSLALENGEEEIVVIDTGGNSTQVSILWASNGKLSIKNFEVSLIKTKIGAGSYGNILRKQRCQEEGGEHCGPLSYPIPEHMFAFGLEHFQSILANLDEVLPDAEKLKHKKIIAIGGLLAGAIPEALAALQGKETVNYQSYHDVMDFSQLRSITREDILAARARISTLNEQGLLELSAGLGLDEKFILQQPLALEIAALYMHSDIFNIDKFYPVQLDGTDTVLRLP